MLQKHPEPGSEEEAGPRQSPTSVPLRLEPAQCCVCHHDDATPLAVGEDFEYHCSPDHYLAMRCRDCGLIYLKLRPAMSELDRVYPANYHAYNFSSEQYGIPHRVRRWLEARRLLHWCRGLPAGSRILDVGCGDGFHLDILREFGSSEWILEGVDTSERAVNAGRLRGLTMHLGTVQQVPLPRGSYDLALLIATIEHVDDPPGVLAAIRPLLRPGGRVLVVTDNTDTWGLRLFGSRHWGGYHFPRHWNLFHQGNLKRLASNAGFEVEHLSTIVSPVNWTYSIHNALVDWGAPAWLVDRFTLASPVSLGVFTIFDWLHQLAGHGGLLCALLRASPSDQESPETADAKR
jgi:SAM-dependent methyltransferase